MRIVAAAVGGTYLLALLASTFGATGVVAELAGAAGGGQTIFLAGLVAVLALRARRAEEDRAAWWSFTAGAAAYLVGGVVYQLLYRDAAVVPRPSWADAAFIAFYPAVYVGLFLMLRSRVRRLTAGMLLDGVVTGLNSTVPSSGR